MIDVFETLMTVSHMEEDEVKRKFGTTPSTVQKVLKGLLLDQLQEEQKINSQKSNYWKKKKNGSKPGSEPSSKPSEKSDSGKESPEPKKSTDTITSKPKV